LENDKYFKEIMQARKNIYFSNFNIKYNTKEKEKYMSLKNAMRKQQRETSTNIDVETLKKTFLEERKKLAKTEMLQKINQ
jgi:hypothetical protein